MRERSVANARGQIECRSTNSIVKVNQQFRFDSSTERLTVSLYAFEYMGGKSCGIFDGPRYARPRRKSQPRVRMLLHFRWRLEDACFSRFALRRCQGLLKARWTRIQSWFFVCIYD